MRYQFLVHSLWHSNTLFIYVFREYYMKKLIIYILRNNYTKYWIIYIIILSYGIPIFINKYNIWLTIYIPLFSQIIVSLIVLHFHLVGFIIRINIVNNARSSPSIYIDAFSNTNDRKRVNLTWFCGKLFYFNN